MEKRRDSRQHFSRIAHKYRGLRVTDAEPIDYIISRLSEPLPEMCILDIGCGTGRYVELLIEKLQSRIKLLCADLSREMLLRYRHALKHDVKVTGMILSVANASFLPARDMIADLVLAFNAIHHFDIKKFLAEAVRVLKVNGILAIYTRTPEQNRETIWGSYFPKFARKERRLYSLDKWERMISASPQLSLEEIRFFYFRRRISPRKLKELALASHYSTFSLYGRQEFHVALKAFEKRIEEEFPGVAKIPHISQNVLILSRKVM